MLNLDAMPRISPFFGGRRAAEISRASFCRVSPYCRSYLSSAAGGPGEKILGGL